MHRYFQNDVLCVALCGVPSPELVKVLSYDSVIHNLRVFKVPIHATEKNVENRVSQMNVKTPKLNYHELTSPVTSFQILNLQF